MEQVRGHPDIMIEVERRGTEGVSTGLSVCMDGQGGTVAGRIGMQ